MFCFLLFFCIRACGRTCYLHPTIPYPKNTRHMLIGDLHFRSINCKSSEYQEKLPALMIRCQGVNYWHSRIVWSIKIRRKCTVSDIWRWCITRKYPENAVIWMSLMDGTPWKLNLWQKKYMFWFFFNVHPIRPNHTCLTAINVRSNAFIYRCFGYDINTLLHCIDTLMSLILPSKKS